MPPSPRSPNEERASLALFRQSLHRSTPLEVELLVTPRIALHMLQRNTRNREARKAGVDYLVAELRAGRWAVVADGIAFDTGGVLIDGQHRLFAIIEADQSVRVRVQFGQSSETRVAIDLRAPVAPGCVLESLGLSQGTLRAATASIYLKYARQVDKRTFSVEDIELAARELGNELDYLAPHYQALSRLGIRAPLFCALALGLRKDRAAVEAFVERLLNFQRQGPNDPVVRFERLTDPVKGRTREDLFNAGLRCLRAHIAGEEIERVRPTRDEVHYFLADMAKAA
ncbi:MAG: hypothetical protein PHE83_17830 [Opitutaceae bacterium]|nr:hypothetical protein [Opitutaceae bacterium]